MNKQSIDDFAQQRERLNAIVMHYADLSIKRFYGLDSQAYREGALPQKTKEMLGLVASLVLRCDDCIKYHIIRCAEEGSTTDEMVEALGIGLVVGGVCYGTMVIRTRWYRQDLSDLEYAVDLIRGRRDDAA